MLEGCLDLGQLLHDRLEAFLGLFLEIDAGQVKVAQRLFDRAAALFRGVIREVLVNSGVGALQSDIL